MFSRIRPRPWGKFVVSALVLIRFGSSRPGVAEPAIAPRLPAVMLETVPEHELLSLTVPDKAGFMPPITRYVVGESCVSTLAVAPVAPLPLVMMPCNVPMHGEALDTVSVRTSVFRLKSKPASKLDGFVSPMNSGSNVVDTVLKRDRILLGGNAKLRFATWQVAQVRPLPWKVSPLKRFPPWSTWVASAMVSVFPASFVGVGVVLIAKSELGTEPQDVEVRFRLTVFTMGRAAAGGPAVTVPLQPPESVPVLPVRSEERRVGKE